VLVSYDGDAAGADATTRSLDLLLERGLEVRVVELPPGKDPDDFVREHGAEAYQRRLREAPEYLEFLIRRQAQQRDRSRIQDKVAGINAVLPHIAKLATSVERAEWAARLGDALGVEDELVLQELRAVAKRARGRVLERPDRPRPLRWNERALVRLALDSEAERQSLAANLEPDDLAGSPVKHIVATIVRLYGEGVPVTLATVHEKLEDEAERELLAAIAFSSDPVEGTAEDCLWACRRERLQRQQFDTVRKLTELEKRSENDDVNRMLSEIQELARQRDTLH
jgi:DNA primase